MLDTLRTLFLSGIETTDEIRIHVGLMSEDQLAELRRTGVDVFRPTDSLVPDMGALYKLMVGVSRGREGSEDPDE